MVLFTTSSQYAKNTILSKKWILTKPTLNCLICQKVYFVPFVIFCTLMYLVIPIFVHFGTFLYLFLYFWCFYAIIQSLHQKCSFFLDKILTFGIVCIFKETRKTSCRASSIDGSFFYLVSYLHVASITLPLLLSIILIY